MSKLPPNLQGLTKDLSPSEAAQVETSILSSPHLQQRIEQALRGGLVEHIRVSPSTTNSGGHYDSDEKAVYISETPFTSNMYQNQQQRLDRITFVLGHEVGHAFQDKESTKALYDLSYQVTQTVRNAGDYGQADLTNVAGAYIRTARRHEADAEIEGWNALASRVQAEPGTAKQADFMKRAALTTDCASDAQGNPRLGRGILLDNDFQMSDDRLPKAGPINREPVSACFFDQKPEDTRLGKEGKSDYTNYYGARVFEEIQDSLQGWQNPPQIQIDMAKLKFRPALLESNGLDLDGQTLRIVDTSNSGRKFIALQHTGSGTQNSPVEETEAPLRSSIQTPVAMHLEQHPAHFAWVQAQSALSRSNIEGLGDLDQHQRERLTASVAATVLNDTKTNMQSIDRVDASTKIDPTTGRPQFLIPGQGDPTTDYYKRVPVDVAQALATPVEQSSEVAKTAVQAREQKQAQELQQTQSQDGPSGPVMRMGARTMVPAGGDSGGGADGGGGGGS
jgi:predicted Zn-dependent protease with MMP-like domain